MTFQTIKDIPHMGFGLLHDLMNYVNQPPGMLQIESHPYLTHERLIKLAQQYGMEVTAFSPLGAMSYFELDMADQHESVLEHSAPFTLSTIDSGPMRSFRYTDA